MNDKNHEWSWSKHPSWRTDISANRGMTSLCFSLQSLSLIPNDQQPSRYLKNDSRLPPTWHNLISIRFAEHFEVCVPTASSKHFWNSFTSLYRPIYTAVSQNVLYSLPSLVILLKTKLIGSRVKRTEISSLSTGDTTVELRTDQPLSLQPTQSRLGIRYLAVSNLVLTLKMINAFTANTNAQYTPKINSDTVKVT